MTLNYSKKVLEHFNNPKNIGEIKNPDGVGEVGNLSCGDMMKLYIKIDNKKGDSFIKDIKFKTFGCVAAIATTSALTEIIKGKTLKQAEKITKDQIAKTLGGLPPIKMHCSTLAIDALKKAIKNYKNKMENKKIKNF